MEHYGNRCDPGGVRPFTGTDPTQVDSETIKDITVMATMVGGEFVYQT
ncbi:unnamed protein product [marine sediment metagenome]|uniref:Uncharacterized protein n=1 Tax=marine sediment metagenome TaxID=412755 RepID=X0TC35_9ZZZZ